MYFFGFKINVGRQKKSGLTIYDFLVKIFTKRTVFFDLAIDLFWRLKINQDHFEFCPQKLWIKLWIINIKLTKPL